MQVTDDEDDDRYHILATSSLTDHVTRVLKHADTFAVFDAHGDVHQRGAREQGLYHMGTRFLSKLRLKLGKRDLLLLSSTVRQNNLLLAADLTNPDHYEGEELVIPYGTLHVLRTKFLWQGCPVRKARDPNPRRARSRPSSAWLRSRLRRTCPRCGTAVPAAASPR
jgi:glycogen debranching enzyme